jgi:hypothetical protein
MILCNLPSLSVRKDRVTCDRDSVIRRVPMMENEFAAIASTANSKRDR